MQYALWDAKDLYYEAQDAYDEAQERFENGEISEKELAEYEQAMNEAEEELALAQEEYDNFETEHLAYLKRIAHESGFIYYNSYGSIRREEYDLTDFSNAVLNIKEEEFMETYSDYPLVRQKYTALKQIILDMGFVF